MQQPLSINISYFDNWCFRRKIYFIAVAACELCRNYFVKIKRSQMCTSRKNNYEDSLFQTHQECKGKNTEIQEIGSIRCTRSNKIAHRKCQCLTESLMPLLPFPLFLCSGGVRYASHLVFPLWLEKHTLSLCFAVVSKEALLISSSGHKGINFQPFFSYFIWPGWRTNSDLSFSFCSGCDLESSAHRPQIGSMTSGKKQTTARSWLLDCISAP